MGTRTIRLNLEIPNGSDGFNRAAYTDLINNLEANAGDLKTQNELKQSLEQQKTDTSSVRYGVDSGSANSKAVTFTPAYTAYKDGMGIAFKNLLQNTGPVTINIDGLGAKAVVKSNGNAMTSGAMKAGSIYTVRYNATTGNFMLQGEGGEYGTATAADVLAPKTIGTDNGLVTGSIPTQGNVVDEGPYSYDPVSGSFRTWVTLPAGYYPQGTTATSDIPEPMLKKEYIRNDANIFGVQGDPNVVNTSDATATSAQILYNQYAYVKGQNVRGLMNNNTIDTLGNGDFRTASKIYAQTGALFVAPPSGYYDDRLDAGGFGKLQITEPNLRKENIPEGMSMFGMAGALPMGGVLRIQGGVANFTDINTVSATMPNAVNLNNAVLLFAVHCTSNQPRHNKVSGKIVSNQVVQFYQNTPTGSSFNCTVRYQVIEFKPGIVKQIIRGQADRITGNATKSVSLAAPGVDTNKTWLIGSYSTNLADPFGYADAYVGFGTGGREILLLGNLYADPNPAIYYTEKWEYQVVEFN